jgi:hypothetical protein
MKLKSIQRLLFFCLSFLFLCTNLIAQPPCASQPPIFSVDTTGTSTTTICNNNPLTLSTISLSSCPDCTYQWSDGTTGPYLFAFTPGTYSVTVTDNAPGGCIGISSVLTINSSTLPTPLILGDSFNICNGDPLLLQVSNPCPTCTYQWFNYTTNTSVQAASTGNASYLATNAQQYYVRVVDTLGCRVNSRIIDIGTSIATVPPLMTTTYSICDSNIATFSTIDCQGCNYEWSFYDYEPEGKLIITGVYDGTRPGTSPRGIELYAIGNIPDLSKYGISIKSVGGVIPGTPTYTFPTSTAVAAGTFIYVTNDLTEFTEFFGFAPDYVTTINLNNPSATSADYGVNAIGLYYNLGLTDVFGDTSSTYLNPIPTWEYEDGWYSRISNSVPTTTFNITEWNDGPGNFHTNRNNAFWGPDAMPIESFTANQPPRSKLVISGVFTDTINGLKARGVELYAIGNIPDLSDYGLSVALDGSGLVPTSTYNLPTGPIAAGTYIYVTDNTTNFANFFGATPTNISQDAVVALIDGNDAIELFFNTSLVDVYGDVSYSGAITWGYGAGWAKSNNNRSATSVFVKNNWISAGGVWMNCATNSVCGGSYNLGTTSFETYYSGLIITGVFDGDRPSGNGPRGIEFYTLDSIPDMGIYSVNVDLAAGTGSTGVYNFPPGPANSGQHFYITNDAAEFGSLFGLPIGPNVNGLNNLNGNDVVELRVGGSAVDRYGGTLPASATNYSAIWSYQDGWAYRNLGTIANNGIFNPTEFSYNQHAYRSTNNVFGTTGRMPIKSYSNSFPGTIKNIISGADTSIYQANIVGDYIVQVQYPSGCIVESDTLSIDTLIFSPRILATIPSSGDTSSNTSYLCFNSTVELTMTGNYLAPPTWSYQWSRNGINLTGEVGFNYSATTSGLYKVEVVDNNGCTAYSNLISIVNSTNGANPGISANTVYLCSETSSVTMSTPPCSGCSYVWETDAGIPLNIASPIKNTHNVTNPNAAGGYLVNVTDLSSGCTYQSPIILIKDTVYSAPPLTASSNTVCSTTPIDLTTIPCAGCNYIWKIDTGGVFVTYDSTQQFTFQIDSFGKYRVEILYPNECRTNFSNTIEATFQTVNANISTPPLRSICNGNPVIIDALPDSISCPTCTYQFLRDSVRMQQTIPKAEQEINLEGNYQVIVTNDKGCADTSTVVTFREVSIATDIRQSAKKICSQSSDVILEVDSCNGCAYQWKIGTTTLTNSQDTFYIATGFAAAETYTVEVRKSGCIVTDSVVLDSVLQELEVEIHVASSLTIPPSPTMCEGSAVVLEDTCQSCITNNDYQYQWFRGGDTIVGGSFEAYQVDTASTYYVVVVDTNNCTARSNSITVQAFDPPANFALDFDTASVLPITYGNLSLDDYLYPISLRNTGDYTSLTAGGAITRTAPNRDSINTSVAGSGFHYITYYYTTGSAPGTCTFTTFDTLEVLGAVAMDILNKKRTYLSIPASEACLYDTLLITVTNFTFIPNEVIFVAGGGNTISVPVNPSLTQVLAGIYSGSFEVIVPAGARTGKITLSDGTDSYQSPNFFLINNPAVTINLLTGAQPICSNIDTAEFQGLPLGGSFSAHYLGMPNDASLLIDSLLLLDSVMNYTAGIQNVMMVYTYTPLYTGTTIACRDSVLDSLLVEVRDVELDSVIYTPISRSQASEGLSELTLITHPISARNYPNTYSGTYVLGSDLLPSTIPTTTSVDSITYEISNGVCLNKSTDPIDIWDAPGLLDSIPTYLCSKDDTVFIQRDTNSIWVTYRGDVIYRDYLYVYSQSASPVPVGNVSTLGLRYTEKINLMEITTSNGGVDSINFLPPNDEYFFIPANVTSTSTTLSFKFSYQRTSNFFINGALSSTETTDYVIAEVSKNFVIEQPAVVAINPVILADTIFCPINNNNQFLGLPAGGRYYLRGAGVDTALLNNIFNPTDILYSTGTSYGLTYVYEGLACVDSAYTGIYLPDPFAIEVRPNNGTGEYCETSPNDSIFFDLIPPSPAIGINGFGIDTSSARFFINNIQSGTVFSPVQVGPPGLYNVRYVVADIYGCRAEARDVFVVSPIPDLSISAIDPIYCLNDDTTQIHLYQTDTSNNRHTLTTWPGSSGIGYVQGETVEFTGDGIINGGGNPTMPYFYPRNAGVGTHDIRYVYADSNSCMDSINFSIQVLPLPTVSMKTASGGPINPFYCENDSISLIGFPISTTTPSGYGTDTSVLYGNPDINSLYPSSLDSASKTFKPFIAGTQPGVLREVLFYYYEDPQGCRDTARYSVTIRNFTTDPTIAGLPAEVCASDVDIPVWANLHGGFDLDSLGYFTSAYPTGFSQIGSNPNTDSIQFYPDSMGIEFANRNVILTFHYSDTSRSCFNQTSDTVLVRALPHLTLSEQLVSSLSAMNPPGAQLIVPPTDDFYHMCETAARIPVYAYNTTGLYDPFTGNVTLAQPSHITPDTGNYVKGRGIENNGSVTNIAYGYVPTTAGYGLDTVRYVFTDATGCTDSIEHYMFVDSLPVLSFGLDENDYNSTINRYVYCETDPSPPNVFAAPTGIAGSSMLFNGQNISLAAPFALRPDTLAVPGVYVDYPLQYNYIGQRYVGGAVCASVLQDTIQIRPAPQLAWVNVPTTYCMLDSLERLPLSATPYGGQFVDETNNYQVIAGIVGDSLFNPAAQPGKRDIFYYYLDTVSGCDDTIQHTIYVYSKPRVNFDISGGCSGTQVDFLPQTAPYGLVYNGVAIDSITMVIWDFGDGIADTLTGAQLPNTLGIPIDTHTYAGSGIFYPSLTVVNQGVCDTTFRRRIIISPRVTPTASIPYVENFDLPVNGWMQESSDTTSVNGIVQDSLWQWGSVVTSNFAGTTFWGTRFTGPNPVYGSKESAWVYSPCFDLDSLDRPMIKMSIWRNTRRGVDGAVLQYHDDLTNTWQVLGQYGKGIKWYQDGYVVSAPGNQVTTPVGWSGANIDWEDARYRLDNIGNDLRGRTDVRFRVAFASAQGTNAPIGAGFAFDSVRIGNRTRNVLTEHFSGLGYPGISQIEDQLYHTIFNNLYGRDVSLIQYHLNVYSNNDLYYNYNNMSVINNTRKLWYGVGDVNRVRIDGKNLVSKTSDLLNYPQLEYLDIESLKDPKFKLEFIGVPAIRFNGSSGLQATVRITALEDLPLKNYALHVVATEDSLTSTGHTRMAVLRDKHLNATGQRYEHIWAAGETYDLVVNMPDVNVTNNPILSRIQLVAFVQNMGDTSVVKEVYQTVSTRNLTRYSGSVDTLDVSVDNVEDQPGYEVSTLKLYPNPTQQLFNVAFEAALEDDYEWELIDVVGRVLKNGKVEAGTTLMQVETERLSSGMYIFIVKNKNVYTQRKVIVQRY